MKISEGEHEAIKTVIRLGAQYGYGNLMSHLASSWALRLVDSGMSEDTAMAAVRDRDCYPLALHIDIVERGEWDETGKRYRKSRGKS